MSEYAKLRDSSFDLTAFAELGYCDRPRKLRGSHLFYTSEIEKNHESYSRQRCWRFRPLEPRELPDPQITDPHYIRIGVLAARINPVDWMCRDNELKENWSPESGH